MFIRSVSFHLNQIGFQNLVFFPSLNLFFLAFIFICILCLLEVFKMHNKDFDCDFLDRTSVAKFLPFLVGWGKLQLCWTKILCGKVARSNDERCAGPTWFLKCYFVLLSFCKVESYFCLKIFIFTQTLCLMEQCIFPIYFKEENLSALSLLTISISCCFGSDSHSTSW